MVRFRLLFIILCFFAQANAQTLAPDFTITDSNGQTHQLYNDYLDQGQTVVLKFFFVDCPPCNAMAPLMEPFYQAWGGGQYDMEMISLSIRPNDDNQDVSMYKQMHGHTWPGAGADGGALDALQPYLAGDFGMFAATPTFVVIATDGTVFFDPKGQSFEETLDSVAVKLVEAGATKAFQTLQNDGQVKNIHNEDMEGIEIGITDVDSNLVQTDEDGEFQLNLAINVFQDNLLTASKSDSHTNGVDIGDLIRIQKHILDVDPFASPYERLAADVDRDGQIGITDILQIVRAVLSIGADFEQNPPWLFLDANYDFANPNAPSDEIYQQGKGQILLHPDDTDQYRLIGIKIGDVDGSASLE